MKGGVNVRVSRDHEQMLKEVKQRFGYPSFSSASQWLTKQVKDSGLLEVRKEEEVPKKKFNLRI